MVYVTCSSGGNVDMTSAGELIRARPRYAVGDGERQDRWSQPGDSVYAALHAPSSKGELLTMTRSPRFIARTNAKNNAIVRFYPDGIAGQPGDSGYSHRRGV